MWISLNELIDIIKSLGLPVYRNKAPKNTGYPYYVYSFVSNKEKKSSNQLFKSLPLYQISLFTNGIETDLNPIETIFNEYRIPFTSFQGIQGDENDDTITNFYTYVRVVK